MIDSAKVPRLLFITNEPPHTRAAGSIYFHRLLSTYPANRLRIITNSNLPDQNSRLDCHYSQLPIWPDRLQRTRFWKLRAVTRCLGGATMLSLSKVRRLASEFEPDAVVTLMQDSWYYELAAKYARRHRLPLVLFIHDLPNIFAPVPNWLRAMQRRRDMSIYAQAVVRFCVSEGMESWFRTQFGIEGDVLLPPRSSRCPSQDPTKCAKLKRPKQLTLGFAGGLHYGYGEQIKNLVPVLRETKTRLELFGPMPSGRLQSLLDETDVLQFNGYATTPEKAWDSLIQRCDALLLPYLNPPGKHQLQYQTHFPSKLGDMLSSGLPLLICGPQEASGVAWFDSRQQAAAIVTPASPSDVRTTIERLRADSNLRIELAREALRLARSFDTDSLSSDFRKSLNRLNIIRQYT